MDIVYSSSDSYSECTGVSLWSLYENNQEVDELNVYVLSTDITEANKEKLNEVARAFSRKIVIIDAKNEFVNQAEQLKLKLMRGAYNTYSRIFLNYWFSNLNKILVIDSDTLVNGSLTELWNIDLTGNLLAAVPEVAMYGNMNNLESKTILDSVPLYYNMGICLVNLREWRETKIDKLIAEKVNNETEEYLIADQSIINKYINHKIVRIPLKFNYYSTVHNVKYDTICTVFCKKIVFAKEEFESARNDPAIIHYFGHSYERPWFKKSVSYMQEQYLKVRNKTPWANYPLAFWKKSSNHILRFYDYFCYILLKSKQYDACLKFRYIYGQKIKGILGMSR